MQTGVTKAAADMKIATGGDVVGFAGDLGTAAAAEELVRLHSGIEILVNNLGIFEPARNGNLRRLGATTGAALRVDGGVVKSAF
jgi:NAD(P)-dependent dehydrogenase (short-subunit alcohol dehydrogenase family)